MGEITGLVEKKKPINVVTGGGRGEARRNRKTTISSDLATS